MLELLEEKEPTDFFDEDDEQETETQPHVQREAELKEISEIIVSGTDWTTATILDQLIRENIQLNPRFQRRDAWSRIRKSRFIESIILGFPIPQIVLASNEKERGKFVVLDGKQRLLTILQFYGESQTENNNFTLTGLEFRPDLNGRKYASIRNDLFLSSVIDNLDNQTIRTIVIRNWHSESFLYKIFLRLNVESTPLSPQELRQALHPGEFVSFLDDQSVKSEALKRIFKSKNGDFRMRDVELLLRYIAFHCFLSEYRGDLKVFLDMACENLNKNWDRDASYIQNEINQFENAINTTISIFGDRNFSRTWMSSSESYRSQFNRAILDSMVFYFSDPMIRKSAEENKVEVEAAFKRLCSSQTNGFRESVEGTTKNVRETYTRLSLWGKALREVLDVEFNVPEIIENRIVFNGLR